MPVAAARVVPPPQEMKRTARIKTGGGVPKHSLSSKHLVINLHRREIAKVPARDLPGEWDHHIPKRKRGSTSEWNPRREMIGGKLWEDRARSSAHLCQAYDLMMSIIRDLQDHHNPKHLTSTSTLKLVGVILSLLCFLISLSYRF
jgi:hypothetical protein